MAKRKAAAEVDPDVQEAEDVLKGVLQQLDNFGVSIVEEQWRAMTAGENETAIAWAAARRIGTKSRLPLCLIPFASAELRAEQDQYLAAQAELRKILAPCVFCKPSFDKSEEGDEVVKMKVKIPDSHMSGSTARELFGKQRLAIEYTRRSVQEFDSLVDVDAGPRRMVTCETEVPSFGWSDGNWNFGFLIDADRFTLEEAIEYWKKQGAIRLTPLGAALEGESAAPKTSTNGDEPKKRGRPKKTEAAAAPKTPALPGVKEEDLTESYSVAMTDKFQVEIWTDQQADGKFRCKWEGTSPAGACAQGEPSVRVSEIESAKGSIGNAVDYWREYSDDQSKWIVDRLKLWLRELESGKTPKLIEAELDEGGADQEEENDEAPEGAVAGKVG